MQRTPLDTIKDFIQVKQHCVFCKSPLRAILTNFEGLGKNGIPMLNAPVKDSKIVFNVSNTTAAYSLDAEGKLDIRTNALVFDLSLFRAFPSPYTLASDEPEGEPRAREVFLGLKPHMQLYCASKACGREYAISSGVFTLQRLHGDRAFAWTVNRFRVWMETFVLDNLWVQNDWIRGTTNIYSRSNPNADAITVPLIDFESMTSTKLLTRVKTLVTFS